MTRLTTERLEYYAALPTAPAERKAIFMYEVRCMARQLLAYEQAGKETKIYQYQSCLFNDENGETDWYWDDCDKGFFEQYDPFHRRILYAAPVLPKQPELPKGFTYESVYPAANFGFGEIRECDYCNDSTLTVMIDGTGKGICACCADAVYSNRIDGELSSEKTNGGKQ